MNVNYLQSMKSWCAVALLVAVGPARAQSRSRTPFPGAIELVVHVPDSGARARDRAARVLTAQGYALRPLVPGAQRVETAPRLVQPPARVGSTVQVRVLGRYLAVQGFFLGPDSLPRPAFPVACPDPNRSRNTLQARGWAELEAVARALQGTVWYQGPIAPPAK